MILMKAVIFFILFFSFSAKVLVNKVKRGKNNIQYICKPVEEMCAYVAIVIIQIQINYVYVFGVSIYLNRIYLKQ